MTASNTNNANAMDRVTDLLSFIDSSNDTNNNNGIQVAIAESKEEEPANKEAALAVYSENTTVLVTGSNRGIGLQFVKQFLSRSCTVICCCRAPESAQALIDLQTQYSKEKVVIVKLDSTSDDDIQNLLQTTTIDEQPRPIDILVLNAGIMGSKAADNHLTTMGAFDRQDMLTTVNVNAIGPILLTQALYKNVAISVRRQVIAISSRMGSIDDCGSNGAFPYRISKSALNMAMQSVVQRSNANADGIHTLVLHPGWVKTSMGGPRAPKPLDDSIQQMLAVIDNYQNLTNGGFYDYNGGVVLW